MRLYLLPVMGMCFCVDGLLLAGASQLSGRKPEWFSVLFASSLGAVLGGAGLIPGLRFMGTAVVRLLGLAVMGLTVFGFNLSGLRSSLLFVLLNMAVGGLALVLGGNGPVRYLFAALIVCLLCLLALRRRPGNGGLVPVELEYQGKRMRLTALLDTGNQLRDPVSGEGVLVVSAEVAGRLLGLTEKQLARPLETMLSGKVKGLRLIPYRTVGRAGGMLLAVRMSRVYIDNKKVDTLVAFAPEGLGENGRYQALAGGMA